MPGQEVLNPILSDGVLDPSGRLQRLDWRTHTTAGEQDLLLQNLEGFNRGTGFSSL